MYLAGYDELRLGCISYRVNKFAMISFNSIAAKNRPAQACLPWPKYTKSRLVSVRVLLVVSELCEPLEYRKPSKLFGSE
jgi:hypothetical protein